VLLNATVMGFDVNFNGEVERWLALGRMSVDLMQTEADRLERMSGMLKRRGIILPAFEIHGGAKGLYDLTRWWSPPKPCQSNMDQSLAGSR